MKKILFSAYSLDIGGIETALITLIKNIHTKYKITLVLEKKEGIFLNEIPENVDVITYKPSKNKIKIIRKISNFIKQQKFKSKFKNKFDFSACYATYSFPCSFVARTASTNNALWVHNDYLSFYNNNVNEYVDFFEKLQVKQYKKIVFVSENDKKVFLTHFPELNSKAVFCNNLIDYKKIIKKSKEQVDDFEKVEKVITFINIGRHNEKQKKLTRIINSTKKLNKEGYKFRVIFVGKGEDTAFYKKQAKDEPNIEFLGAKKNPYPYIEKSDCVILSSDFEGYPVVFIEAEILKKPIITTDVSDSRQDIENKYGIVTQKTEEAIYKAMKKFLDEGFVAKEFNPDEFNKNILEKIERIIEKNN